MGRKYIYVVIQDGCSYDGEYENCASVSLHATEEDAKKYIEDAMRTCVEDDLFDDGIEFPTDGEMRKHTAETCEWYGEHDARFWTLEEGGPVTDWKIERVPLPVGV